MAYTEYELNKKVAQLKYYNERLEFIDKMYTFMRVIGINDELQSKQLLRRSLLDVMEESSRLWRISAQHLATTTLSSSSSDCTEVVARTDGLRRICNDNLAQQDEGPITPRQLLLVGTRLSETYRRVKNRPPPKRRSVNYYTVEDWEDFLNEALAQALMECGYSYIL